MPISILILVFSLGGLIFRVATAQRAAGGPGSLTVLSIRQPREILWAARQFFAEGGWAPTTRSANNTVFSYDLRPSGPVLVLLLLLGIIPGLLALTIGKKRLTVTVSSDEDDGGSATLVSWSSADSEPACRDFALMIRSQEPRSNDRKLQRQTQRRDDLGGRRGRVRVPRARRKVEPEHLRISLRRSRPRFYRKVVVPPANTYKATDRPT